MLNKNPKKMLTKFSSWLPCLIICSVMVFSLLASLLIATPQPAHAATLPAYRYTKTFDTSGGFAQGNSVATDNSGNIYIAGQFQGTVVFDGVGGSDSVTSANTDSFLTRYNANGSYAWTKTFDTSASGAFAESEGVATDGNGNIYVAGDFNANVVFDGVGGSDTQNGGTNDDSYLTKYNADGSYAYTKTFDVSASGSSFAFNLGVTTDSSNNVYVTGCYGRTVVFDGVGGSDSRNGGSRGSGYVTKYNANGNYVFTKTSDASTAGAFAEGRGVATDSSGNIYMTGDFEGTVTFDGTGGSDTQDGGTNGDSYLTKYNADGSYAYTKSLDVTAGGSNAQGNSVATDSSGNVYIAGQFQGTVVFDGVGGSDAQTARSGTSDSFITRYNANGSYAFTKTFDVSASGAVAEGRGVAVDSSGNIYETGEFQGTVIFDGTGGSDSQDGGTNSDSYLTKYNADGSYAYTKTFDMSAGGSLARGKGVATDSSGNVYVTGIFSGTVGFDGSGGSDVRTSSNNSFLTSFQVANASTPSGGSASPAATPPGAPNTGVGVYMTDPLPALAICSLISAALVISAVTYSKKIKQ